MHPTGAWLLLPAWLAVALPQCRVNILWMKFVFFSHLYMPFQKIFAELFIKISLFLSFFSEEAVGEVSAA